MTYKERYECDMDDACEQIQKATASAWNSSDYKIIQALNVIMQLVSSVYKIVAEIGDKVNEESGSE